MMDAMVWVSAVIALANMSKALTDALKAGLDLREARRLAVEASHGGEYSASESESELATKLLIDKELLETYVLDIRRANERFVSAVSDERNTRQQLEAEESLARDKICTHMNKIRDFNGGSLPDGDLGKIYKSWRCKFAKD